MTLQVLLDLDKVCSNVSLASVVSRYQCLDEVRECAFTPPPPWNRDLLPLISVALRAR